MFLGVKAEVDSFELSSDKSSC